MHAEKLPQAFIDTIVTGWWTTCLGDRATTAQACAQRAEVLWFLHADSLPPPDALARIRAAFTDGRVVGGAFEHRFHRRRGVAAPAGGESRRSGTAR
jgi:hypothetical protein